MRPRLEQHAARKDFWTTAIVFTSKDTSLNKAHVQYLESRLLEIAADAKRCQLDNGNFPALPSLSEPDTAEIEGFLDEMLLCLPVLGVQLFEKPPISATPATVLHINTKGISASGYEAAQGFIVRAGSQALSTEVASIHGYLSNIRQALIKSGILAPDGMAYRFQQDYSFASPSTAAGVVLGRSANGRTEWQTAIGQTLKSLQEAEANE